MTSKIFHSLPSFSKEEERACARVLKSHYIASGPENKKLVNSLCKRYKRKHAVLVSSGAAALFLALNILKKKHQNVILPSYVCSALLNSVLQSGLKPKVVDTPLDGIFAGNKKENIGFKFNVEKDLLIYPQMFGIIKNITFPSSLKVIEDCAMSLGSNSLRQGDISIMSMYATKMMTSGQGGALLMDNSDAYEECLDLLNYDNRDSYRLRYNYSLSDLSAAVANVQLKKLPSFIEKRKKLCVAYDKEFLKKMPNLLVSKKGFMQKYKKDAPFRYWVHVSNVEACIDYMASNGIEAKRPVYQPLHRYLNLKDKDYPNAVKSFNRILSLPLYPDLKVNQIKQIVDSLTKVAKPYQ